MDQAASCDSEEDQSDSVNDSDEDNDEEVESVVMDTKVWNM